METIQTERLTLRRPTLADAPEIARQIAQWDVIRWLTSPPWPYTLGDAETYLTTFDLDWIWAITREDTFMGVVGCHPTADGGPFELGYWLGRDHWGQGYMTEAVSAVVGRHFANGHDHLMSGYLTKNQGSKNVLLKIGFVGDGVRTDLSRPLGHDVEVQRMILTRDRFEARNGRG